jgi:hypothetical protein
MDRKHFKIPNQIDHCFYLWRFIKFQDLVFLTPLAICSMFLYKYLVQQSSCNPFYKQIGFFLSLLPLVVGTTLIYVRPLRFRNNVTLFKYLLWMIQYKFRQRMFFYQKKSEVE